MPFHWDVADASGQLGQQLSLRSAFRSILRDTDARFGQIPESLIWDFSSYVWLSDNVKLFGGMQNMFDTEYLTSLHPYGARPGMPFFGYLGIEATY